MPFTQAEIQRAVDVAHDFHGVPRGFFPAPLVGTVRMRCPVDGSACHDLFCQRNGCQGDT